MSLKLNKPQVIYILVSLIYLILAIFNIVTSYKAYEYFVMIIFLYLFFLTLKERNFSLYQVFLVSYFVFLLDRIFMDCIGLADMRKLNLYESSYMTDEIAIDTLRTVGCFLISTSYAWIFTLSKEKNEKAYLRTTHFEHKANNKINQLIKIGFYFFTALAFVKGIILLKIVMTYGYKILFNESIDDMFPVILNGSIPIFYVFYSLLIFYNRNENDFKKYTFIYIIISFTRLFGGSRASFFCNILLVAYIWSTYYKEIKIVNKKVIALAAMFPIVAESISVFRFGSSRSMIDILKSNVFFDVMYSQGVTLTVVANTIKYLNVFSNKVPFFLGYITDLFQIEPVGQVIEDIQYGNYLGDHLTYIVSPSSFLSGSGTGTSLVAEIYELVQGNMPLLIVLTFFIFYIVLQLCKSAYKSLPRFCATFYLALDVIFCPRGSILKSLKYIIIALLISYIISIFENHSFNKS